MDLDGCVKSFDIYVSFFWLKCFSSTLLHIVTCLIYNFHRSFVMQSYAIAVAGCLMRARARVYSHNTAATFMHNPKGASFVPAIRLLLTSHLHGILLDFLMPARCIYNGFVSLMASFSHTIMLTVVPCKYGNGILFGFVRMKERYI